MFISRCKYCKQKVSLFSRYCDNCGKRIYHPIFGIVIFVLLMAVVFLIPMIQPGSIEIEEDNHETEIIKTDDDSSEKAGLPLTESIVLSAGTYKVGDDIPPGKYDCIAASGFGVLRGDIESTPNFVQTMGSSFASVGGISAGVSASESYQNLLLQEGDTIIIEMSLSVEFKGN